MSTPVILPDLDAVPLPAPPLLMHALLLATFLLHLLAMNALLGAVFIALWSRVKVDPVLADTLAGPTPTLVAMTVTLGVPPLLFLQALMGRFFFTSSVLMAWPWFSLVIVLIFAYYGTYLQAMRGARLGAARTPLLALTALGFLWISFLFSNNTSLMLVPERWAAMYFADAGGSHLNPGDASLWPRWLHAICGAVAVAGAMLAWWGKRRPDSERMTATGLRIFTWLTGANLLVGTWYFLAQPSPVRKALMGGSVWATALFGLGFVLGIGLLAHGVTLLRGERYRTRGLTPLLGLVVATLAVMVLQRDAVRAVTLGGYYSDADFTVQTQALNLALFGALLAAGIVVTVWMLRQLAKRW